MREMEERLGAGNAAGVPGVELGMAWMIDWWWAFWGILVESGWWLVVGFLIAGVLHVLVPQALLERALGGGGGGSVVRGALVGAPIPLCSCSVIPTAAGLKRSGASRGAAAAFAVASPEVDVPAVGLTWGLLGPWFAITRPVVAIAIAIAAGLSLDRIGKDEKEPDQEPEDGGVSLDVVDGVMCCEGSAEEEQAEGSSCCCRGTKAEIDDAGSDSLMRKLFEVVRFAAITLPGSLAGWMLLGLGIAALITVLVPADWATGDGASGLQGMGGVVVQSLAALVIGIPLYVCATSSTPLALAMLVAGVEPGAALVFLLAGPATNPATIAWVIRDFGARSAVVYVGVIAGGSLAAGLALNGVLADHLVLAPLVEMQAHGGSAFGQISAGVLLLALVFAMGRSMAKRLGSTKKQTCCSSEG